MISQIFTLPKSLTTPSAIKFIEDVSNFLFFYDEIVIDCSKLDHVEPFSMLLIVTGILKIKKDYPKLVISSRGPYKSYPSFMGLFYFSKLSNSNFDNNYKLGNPRYSKIRKINTFQIREKANSNFRHFCEELEEMSSDLASVLSRSRSSEIYKTLSFTIREILRNVLEHSSSDDLYFCAQYWPSQDKVEIGIIDSGIGLRNSLNRNPDFEIYDDNTAINYATTPGVSGVKYVKGGPKSEWQNSGYGLFMTSRICQEGGSFLIMSGTQGLFKNSYRKTQFKCNHFGTGVRLVIKPSMIKNIENQMATYRNDANDIIKANGGVPNGDSPSTILKVFRKTTEDF